MSTSAKNYDQLKQEFCKRLDKLAHGTTVAKVFSDWVEVAAITKHQEPYHLGLVPKDETWEKLEQAYLAIVPKYSREQLNEFAALMGMVQLALDDRKGDFLGEIYQELELAGQQRNSEFFTPYAVSKMCASMALLNMQPILEKQGYASVSEPACGAGGMLIATAEVMQEAGHNPERCLWFEATDINRDCFNMAYLQLACLGIAGHVKHGDTLKQEIWEVRETPAERMYRAAREGNPMLQVMLGPAALVQLPSAKGELLQEESSQNAISNTNKNNIESFPETQLQLDLFKIESVSNINNKQH